MLTLFARVTVKPEHVPRFLRYLEADAAGSIAEPGCLRFDISRDDASPNVFYLYEVYRDQAAYDVHKKAPYFTALFAEAGDTLASPPEGFVGTAHWPQSPEYWNRKG
jgi:autoinducer 2-degrading protein